MKKYFLSFIEEYWPGQIEGTWIGRVEYKEKNSHGVFPNELGIGTSNRVAVIRLRDKYDFKTVSKRKFLKLKRKVSKLNEVKK